MSVIVKYICWNNKEYDNITHAFILLKVDMLCSHEYFAKGDAETVDARDDREVQPPLKFNQYEYFILCLNTLLPGNDNGVRVTFCEQNMRLCTQN